MTDLQKLRAENHRLKVDNWRLRMQIDSAAIDASGKTIETECLMSEPVGSTFDWQTLTVILPQADNTPPKES